MWKLERTGLVLVAASLVVIASILVLLFQYQRDTQLAEIQKQGVAVARVLRSVPYESIVEDASTNGIVRLLQYALGRDVFAYSSIVNLRGTVLSEANAEGVIVPPPILPEVPSAWFGQRELTLPGDGRRLIEFHAPALQNGELMGFVRIGYFYPEVGLSAAQLPFLASFALPIFLLTPLFYFLLRREVKPLQSANEMIVKALDSASFGGGELSVSSEMNDFMQRFNRFISVVGDRIAQLEGDRTQLETSGKLITYRKNRIETVLETMPEAVIVLDESGSITFANNKVAALFGTSVDVIMNRPANEWCHNPDVSSLLGRFEENTSARSFMETMRFKPEFPIEKSYATKSYPLFSPRDPSVSIGTLIIFRDETREAMARQARVDFVAHLSHELKSPLNVLGMYSESLLGEAGKSEEFRIEAANVITTEVRQLSALISGLLNMTQIESGSLSPEKSIVKLGELISGAFDEATHLAKDKDIQFAIEIPKEISVVAVDKALIRIALSNLLSNAVKYNRPGGTVTLTASETEDAIQIKVADTGIGISDDEKERIFDKFYRSEDDAVTSQNGHGLGLALARQIIELHHGALTCESVAGEGTEFLITLWKEAMLAKQAI